MPLESWINALELLRPLAVAVPVVGSPVQGSLEAAISILKLAQGVKTNKEQSKELAEQAARWTQSLVNALDEVKTDTTELERMRTDVNPIREMLETIAMTMRRRARQSKATQMLNKSKNEEELTKLRGDLKDAYERFMVSSQIRAQSALSTLITAADADALGKLTPISSARYDSLASPPGCLEGTRQEILAEMFTWAEEPSQGLSVFWLAGLAGTGKSTIAKTFCERLATKGTLMATFFASRNSAERRDPLNVIHTFAYELATADPHIRPHVLSAVRSPPDIMQRPMQEQIGRLLAASLSQARNGGTLVLVIDALDECDRIGRVEGGALIPMLAEALRNLPVKLLVTSRQEKSLVGMFKSLDHIPLRLHEVATEVVEPDVRHIFETGFAEIRREHELTAELWPSLEDVDSLVRLTGRFFIFAATALRYIGDSHFSPTDQLQRVLARGATLDGEAPYDHIDALYTDILQAATRDDSGKPNARLSQRVGDLLRTIVLLEEPLSVTSLAHLMAASEADISKSVGSLAAILLVADTSDASMGVVQIFHPSLRDFLCDPARCFDSQFLVNTLASHHVLARRCLLVLNRSLVRDICRLENPTRPNLEITDLALRLQNYAPGSVRYACTFWLVHLTASETPSDSSFIALLEFCREHLLHWIELLSLLSRLPAAADQLPDAISWCQSSRISAVAVHEAAELLNDSYRLLLAYYPPIHSHALHVYESTIATMPKCALLATAETDAAAGACLLSAREGDWSRRLRVIESGDTHDFVAFSPDGTQIVSACSHRRAVRLWNAKTGDPLAALCGHMLPVLCVAFSPDGVYIVSGSLDSTVRLWDARTYRQRAVIYAHPQITDDQAMRDVHSWSSRTHAVHCVSFSPAGSLIAYGFASGNRGLRLYDSVTGTQAFLPVGQDIQVTTVAFSPDGSKLVSGSMHGVVYVWDVQTRTQVAALQGHGGMIRSVSFSPDGARLVSGANDVTIRVWNMRTHKSACLLEGHSNVVKSVAYSSDGRHIVSGSWDGTIRVWDAQSTKQLVMFHGHHPIVNCVAVSSSDERLVSAGMDSSIQIWDMRTRSQSTANECGSNRTDNLVLSRDGALLVSTTDNYGKIWDMQTYKHIATLEGHTSQISVAAFSYDGTRVVSGSYDSIVRVWDARIGQQLAVFEGHEKGVSAVAFSPDGLRVVSGSYDESVRLWEMRTSTQIAVFHPAMSSQAFDATIPTAPDTLDESKSASQDDRASHVALSSKGIQVGKVYPTALHGGPVAPLSSDLTLGQLVSSREPHTEVSAVASSPEGLHVISASFDGSIRVWDVMRATQIALLEEHSSPVTSVEFSFDGSWLRSFDLGGKELAWDFQHIVTQQRVSSPREVNCAAPVTTSLTDDSMPVRRNGLAHVLESADYPLGTSWLYCTAGPDSKTLLPLCWLPIERRGRALFRGYIAIVVGMGGNVIVLDFTDTIERLQSLGIL